MSAVITLKVFLLCALNQHGGETDVSYKPRRGLCVVVFTYKEDK